MNSESEFPSQPSVPEIHPAAYRQPEDTSANEPSAHSGALPVDQAATWAGGEFASQPSAYSAPAPSAGPAQSMGSSQPAYQQPNYAQAPYGASVGYGPQAVAPQANGYRTTSSSGSAPRNGHPQTRSGALIAGIAIGALLGGVIGGGTAAVVASNVVPEETQTVAGPAGTFTLNSAEEVGIVAAVAAVATPSVVTLSVSGPYSAGSGSGVIYSEDGYIVTNAHVATLDGDVGAEAEIRVQLSDGRVIDGALVGVDPFSDLAVVKVEADGLTPVAIGDSDALNVGDTAVVIGAPLNLANTVTSGVVSAMYRGISVGTTQLPDGSEEQDEDRGDDEEGSPWNFRFGEPGEREAPQQRTAAVTLPVIQTDASINPGNSGGALLNSQAELIGINVAIASNRGEQGTAGSDGLGFAIPVNLTVRVVDAIIAGEQPSHGLLGAGVDDSSRATGADANRTGALIVDMTPGGAAEEAGFEVGDVVTAIDGIPVDSGTSLSALVRMQAGGSEVTLTYTRGGVVSEIDVTLGTLDW